MKYFLTGATGFVGGVLAQKLRQQGHAVIAIVRTPAKAANLAKIGVELQQGDITDKESMRAAMGGVDGVFHVAGWYKIGTPDKQEGQRINVDGTRNVLELMQELAIPKGVYTSTLAVNSDTQGVEVDERYHFTGRHLSVYDQTKADAHKVAEQFIAQGLPLVIVQPGLIYGPGDAGPSHDAFVQLLQRKLPLLPQKTAYSWAHVADVVDAHIAAMAKGKAGENYFICGPTHTLIDGMRLVAQISGIPAPKLTAPPSLLSAMSAMMSVIEPFVALPPTYTAEYLRVSAGVTYIGQNGKARRELGFNPRSLDVGLRETISLEMQALGMKMPNAAG
jgi:nucleoside-diphosphate-sugar epimerase